MRFIKVAEWADPNSYAFPYASSVLAQTAPGSPEHPLHGPR
jgi:hypothetical protein